MHDTTPPPQPQQNLPAEDLAWLEQAASEARRQWNRIRRHSSPAAKAQALANLSGYLLELEGPASALRLSRKAHRLWEDVGDPRMIAISSAVLTVHLMEAGHLQEALRQSVMTLEAMRGLPLEQRHTRMARCLGKEFLRAGYAAEGQRWLELALESPAHEDRAEILTLLSRALDLQGRLPEARERQQEACEAHHQQGDMVAMARSMLDLVRLELRLGRNWHAATLCREAPRILDWRGAPLEAAEARALDCFCGHPQRTDRHGMWPTARRGARWH